MIADLVTWQKEHVKGMNFTHDVLKSEEQLADDKKASDAHSRSYGPSNLYVRLVSKKSIDE